MQQCGRMCIYFTVFDVEVNVSGVTLIHVDVYLRNVDRTALEGSYIKT